MDSSFQPIQVDRSQKHTRGQSQLLLRIPLIFPDKPPMVVIVLTGASLQVDNERMKKKEAWPLVSRPCDTHFDVLWLRSHINIRICEQRL
jgi:hypothetical protein